MSDARPPKPARPPRPLQTVDELCAVDASVDIGTRRILHGVDLAFSPAQLTALIGPNGAGKSTLLSLLAGDVRPASGRVTLGGTPLERLTPRQLAARRAVLPQRPTVGFAFTVRQVVELGRHAPRSRLRRGGGARGGGRAGDGGMGGDDMGGEDVVDAALEQVGLTGYAGRPIDTLSGGEAARAHLARVLAQQAPILLLDEPTAALDLHHQHLVVGIARRHVRRGGTAIVVLHDMNLAAAYADRVVLLDGGAVLADGPCCEVLTAPRLTDAYRHPVRVLPHPDQRWQLIVADRVEC